MGIYSSGKIKKILLYIIERQPYFVQSSYKTMADITLSETKKSYSDDFCLVGNVSTSIPSFGTINDIENETKNVWIRPKNESYIFMYNDEVSTDTKIKNVHVLIEYRREFDKY